METGNMPVDGSDYGVHGRPRRPRPRMPKGWVVRDLVRAPNLDPAVGEISIYSSVINTPQFRIDLAEAIRKGGFERSSHTVDGCIWLLN
jgi:hypothetical protein